jgi:hypothetical protein
MQKRNRREPQLAASNKTGGKAVFAPVEPAHRTAARMP